jgi:hypothetical protein
VENTAGFYYAIQGNDLLKSIVPHENAQDKFCSFYLDIKIHLVGIDL